MVSSALKVGTAKYVSMPAAARSINTTRCVAHHLRLVTEVEIECPEAMGTVCL